MKKRWYELSADACILISMIELAQEPDRERYAQQLTSELINLGYEPDPDLYENCSEIYSMNRWYDSNKEVFLAIEYLKDAQNDVQLQAISRISDYMRAQMIL